MNTVHALYPRQSVSHPHPSGTEYSALTDTPGWLFIAELFCVTLPVDRDSGSSTDRIRRLCPHLPGPSFQVETQLCA